MNLAERYYSKPGNYIIEAGGGHGKSTSLKYLSELSFERRTAGKKEIPVYIPMAELNFQEAQPGILFDYLKQFFSNKVTVQALKEMIADSRENIQYLFLLDGLNEVHNYEIHGQTVLDYIYNDILCLLGYENVNILISVRAADLLPDHLKAHFKLLVLKPLSNEAIDRYLSIEKMTVIPGHIQEMLKNPMLLTIFKKLYDWNIERAVSIDNKYDLFELYFRYDSEIHLHAMYSDHLQKVRRYVVEQVLPYVAFRREYLLLGEEPGCEQKGTELLEEACLSCGYPENVRLPLVCDVIQSLRIVDEDLCFTHELFRDYFAAKGLVQAGRDGRSEEMASFLERLTNWLEYRDNRRDLPRRTRFLDLADCIFSVYQSDLLKKLKSAGIQPEERRVCLAARFYQELSGVYDDLSNGAEAARIGWIALDYLKISEPYLPRYIVAKNYSFLYYVVKWDKKETERCRRIILHAKAIMDQTDESERDQNDHDLYGKILSNIGSYYYKLGTEYKSSGNREESCSMFREAETWHLQALDYRIEYCDGTYQAASFRTLMSDAYQLEDYAKGYQYYCEALRVLSPYSSLEESMMFGRDGIPEDLVERALGSEYELLKRNSSDSITDRILKDLPGQIRYIYYKSTELGRKNLKMLGCLEEKLNSLKSCQQILSDKELSGIVDDYLKRCTSFN